MLETQFKIEGLDDLLKRLGNRKSIIDSELKPALADTGKALVGDLSVYPAAPSSSTYARTGDLGRAWKTQPVVGPGQKIGNAVASRRNGRHYAEFVQGPKQARVHRGRWLNVIEAVQKRMPWIQNRFTRAAERIVSKVAYGR